MIRTQYYTRDNKSRTPQFNGPTELTILGVWVSGDIQLSGYSILEAIDLARQAQANPDFTPEEMDGNAYTATFSHQVLAIENHFLEHVRGEFSMDAALAVLLDFWDYYARACPDEVAPFWKQYVEENSRDPLAGLRDVAS
ncbi:hypothetical protein [Streptomyces sp. LaBMicrA B280]|uniref:hypothetical protein n=1 Tax=Streptomyces sp. LaBMicrA B280 TaxID=3391001 RepID=UPI003BA6F77C